MLTSAKTGPMVPARYFFCADRLQWGCCPGQAGERKLVKEELKQLNQLYADYHSGLEQLHRLAKDYKTTRRDIKLKLRRQQSKKRNGN